MRFKSTSILLLTMITCCSHFAYGQNAPKNHPLNVLFQKGVQDLRQGDTIAAFQNIQSAYTFSPAQEDISFYYFSLLLILDKPNAAVSATKWLGESNNKIYHARINYLLGKYYFKKQEDDNAFNSFSKVPIDALENFEIIEMNYFKGYLYFKKGDWDKAFGLLNSVSQIKESHYYTDANYYTGFIALQKKEFTQALQCFKIASANNAYLSLTPFYISQIYYFMGDVASAMVQAEAAIKLPGQFYSLQLQQLMGHLLFEKKEYLKAIPFLSYYVTTQPQPDKQDIYQLSFCYFQNEQWINAIEGFKALASIEDSLGQNSMYLLATSYLKVNDKNGAKNAFLLCATKSENLVQKEIALFNYAKLSAELKEYGNAITSLDKFIENYPKSDLLNEAKSLWVSSLALSNNYEQAFNAYNTIELPSIDLLKLYPTILYGRATMYLNGGQVEKGYSLLYQLLHIPYNNKVLPATLFWIGELSYKMGRIQDATDYLEKFILTPTELGEISLLHARYTLGYCYLKSGAYQNALTNFAAIINAVPANNADKYQKDAFVRVADCQMMLKLMKQSLESFQNIIDLGWTYMDYATLEKAILLGGMNKPKEKLNILTNFDIKFPSSTYINDARMELADTYINQENFQEAIAPLAKISLDINATSFYPQAYYKLGLVYFNLNKNEVALDNFRELYTKYPKSVETDNSIEFIRNIFIEDQQPERFVQFMNEFGKPLSFNEQDSLIYRSSVIKYEQNKYTEAAQGFSKYLIAFPAGRYQLEASNLIAEINYSQQHYDTAAFYFAKVADQAPNKFAERASLLAARLNYFNFKQNDLAEKYFTILNKIATQQENKTEATKGLLRCAYKAEKWADGLNVAKLIVEDKLSASDDIEMANMVLYHQSLISADTSLAIAMLNKLIKNGHSLITAEAHYQLAQLYLNQNKLALAEKTAFEMIKKQAAYEYWMTKAYILLGDIYVAQKDNFNAMATYKSVAENATNEELKLVAAEKLKLLTEQTTIK
jgi:TolA-binding protein